MSGHNLCIIIFKDGTQIVNCDWSVYLTPYPIIIRPYICYNKFYTDNFTDNKAGLTITVTRALNIFLFQFKVFKFRKTEIVCFH